MYPWKAGAWSWERGESNVSATGARIVGGACKIGLQDNNILRVAIEDSPRVPVAGDFGAQMDTGGRNAPDHQNWDFQ